LEEQQKKLQESQKKNETNGNNNTNGNSVKNVTPPVRTNSFQKQKSTGSEWNDSESWYEKQKKLDNASQNQKILSVSSKQNDQKPAMSSMPLMSNYWNIDWADIEIGEQLGEGAFAVCFKGVLWGKTVAVKVLKNDIESDDSVADYSTYLHTSYTTSEELLKDFQQEINVMSYLRHPNTVLLMGACIDPKRFAIVTEFCSKGSVEDLVYDKKKIDWKLKVKIARDTAIGTLYLHKMKIIHLDLKPANLLLDDNLNVKVADFGLSRLMQSTSKCSDGTPGYMSLEQFEGREVTSKVDVYAYHIVLWELLTQIRPWDGINSQQELVDALKSGTRNPISPQLEKSTPRWFLSLIDHCGALYPQDRPTFDDILKNLIVPFCALNTSDIFWKNNISELPINSFQFPLKTV